MPRRPKRPCSFPSCPCLTDGQYCAEHEPIMEARYNKYDRDPMARRRYGRMWPRIRAQHLAKYPLCKLCHDKGEATPANEVHHILPLSKGGTHATDNLMSLCKRCHSRLTAKEGGRWRSR